MAVEAAEAWARSPATALGSDPAHPSVLLSLRSVSAGDTLRTEPGYHWLLLWGDKEVGKTHLLAAAFYALLTEGLSPIYTVVPALLDHIRGGYDAGDYGERFDTVMQTPILLLDDLGAETRSRWTDEALFKLLDHRYRYELPTAVASNVPPCDLEERIASRLQDVMLSVTVELSGPDTRRTRQRTAS